MMTEKHILFTLHPWFEEERGPYYCPECGVVEGFLHYSPEIRDKIEIVAVHFPRPRQAIVAFLGQENQGCPVLVLAEGTKMPEGGRRSLSTGRAFISNGLAICDFLAVTFNGVKPHP